MPKRKSPIPSQLDPLSDPTRAKAWCELDRAIANWNSSDLGLELQQQNPRLFNRLTDNLRQSQRFLYGPESLKSAIISVSEIVDLENILKEAGLSLAQIDSAFIDDITAAWDLFKRYEQTKKQQAARKTRYNTEVRRYDRAVKLLKTCPHLEPEVVTRLEAEIRLPSTHDTCRLGGFDESGPLEGRTAFVDPPEAERSTLEELRVLRLKDCRYQRLPKVFRCWPVWKDTMRSLTTGWNRKFSKTAEGTVQMKRVAVYSPDKGSVQCHRKTIEAITKLLHLCFPLWFPDNRTVTEGILYR